LAVAVVAEEVVDRAVAVLVRIGLVRFLILLALYIPLLSVLAAESKVTVVLLV
jgi:hypothetical protein